VWGLNPGRQPLGRLRARPPQHLLNPKEVPPSQPAGGDKYSFHFLKTISWKLFPGLHFLQIKGAKLFPDIFNSVKLGAPLTPVIKRPVTV